MQQLKINGVQDNSQVILKSRVCLIGTYPPRECGIGTFTWDLRHAIEGGYDRFRLPDAPNANTSSVIAMTNQGFDYEYPPEVVFEIRHNNAKDYRLAAEYINFSDTDVVCLQHEFGIFGGAEGRLILDLLKNLRKPVVTTLHTILRQPETGYKETLQRIAKASDQIVVMNGLAIPMLRDVYGVSEEKISLIHHGVPDVPFVDSNYYKDKFGVEGKLVILTFGLLSRNKGIELMIEALPAVVERHADVVYIVLGATHPEVKRRQGEEYRFALKRRVRELGLENNVKFYETYVDAEGLKEFIGASDIYVTPYQSAEQIVSGTLAYAVGMGKAVVSTPYLYAEELLADERGRLVDFGDKQMLSEMLNELIEDDAGRHAMRKRAYQFGRQMTWEQVGREYVRVFDGVVASYETKSLVRALPANNADFDVPEINLDALRALTDDTGIIQHAVYGVPDLQHGYATDDAARALVVALRYYDHYEDESVLPLVTKYLAFLRYAQREDGSFYNFMTYARTFVEDEMQQDTTGRALWGLGSVISCGHAENVRVLAREMFERALDQLDNLHHPRALAYAICGLEAFLVRYDGAAAVRRRMNDLAQRLVELYESARREDWHWFGGELTYANAKVSEAMLIAAKALDDENHLKIGLESLDFLLKETYRDGIFDFIGNQGWYSRDGERAVFGQQPIEAGYTIEACTLAYNLTNDNRYLEMSQAAVEWFLGRNRLGVAVYDLHTGACADGLDSQGASMNYGAESVICCLLGLLAATDSREQRLDALAATASAAVAGAAGSQTIITSRIK